MTKRKAKSKPGNCYAIAWTEITLINPIVSMTLGEPMLAHGYPRYKGRGRRAGRRFGHAWIECGPIVIDGQITAPKAQYYKCGRIDPQTVRLYSRAEALELAARHGHYGPWSKPPGDAMFARQ